MNMQQLVIPAKAGIQNSGNPLKILDSRFYWNDEIMPFSSCYESIKFDRNTIFSRQKPHVNQAPSFKEYVGKEKIMLHPEPEKWIGNIWKLLQQRRSERKYGNRVMNKNDLSLLLWACQGVTAQTGQHLLRTAPSAGALYPVETYVAIENVEEINPGLFHYGVRDRSLARLSDSPPGKQVAGAALDQGFLGGASVVFIWSAIMRRTISKYGHRGMRYIFMDAGHICQNLLLAAEALGFAACPVAAFYDEECNDLIGLDGGGVNYFV
jgi:SagB-type dehydrogenase family enzyme